MKVLVTGGTGFTGSHLVRRLIGQGNEVLVIDNQKGLFYDELVDIGAKIHVGSVTDEGLLAKVVPGCEVVYHLAAAFRQMNVPESFYWNVNVTGTKNLLASAHQCQVRKFVYCSTQGVHGNIDNPPGDEQSPIAPEDYYQLTKYEGEKLVQEYVARGLDAVVIRPTAIYGPGDPERFFMLFRQAKKGTFPMFGNGETYYHPVYIDNLVDAFELATQVDGQGQAYIVGDEEYFSLNELVHRVAKALGVPIKIRHYPFTPLRYAAWACEVACELPDAL